MPTDLEKIILRREQIFTLARKYNYEPEHSHHDMILAVKLFDRLQLFHALGPVEREWLEYAAILHDIGWIEGQKAHHKTALRLIVAAELPLFTDQEKIIIGLIARYHRKSLPKDKHEYYQDLNDEFKKVVSTLGSFLRLADGLDRTHASCIEDFECEISDEKIILKVTKAKTFSKIDLELGLRKSDLLQLVFHRKFEIDWKNS
jgi:exopolyphosphatase/guanosine-5'-triphosphate,3'-diphosphate pyrophosphatase